MLMLTAKNRNSVEVIATGRDGVFRFPSSLRAGSDAERDGKFSDAVRAGVPYVAG